jgi:hypothetical protein
MPPLVLHLLRTPYTEYGRCRCQLRSEDEGFRVALSSAMPLSVDVRSSLFVFL